MGSTRARFFPSGGRFDAPENRPASSDVLYTQQGRTRTAIYSSSIPLGLDGQSSAVAATECPIIPFCQLLIFPLPLRCDPPSTPHRWINAPELYSQAHSAQHKNRARHFFCIPSPFRCSTSPIARDNATASCGEGLVVGADGLRSAATRRRG